MNEYRCRFDDLLSAIDPMTVHGDVETIVSSVCYDSRLALPGSLFVALKGGYADGHKYLADAWSRGAKAALVQSWSDEVERFQAAALVSDTRASLAHVARRFYDSPGDDLGVIGVTGTDGKTTTTFLIDAILRHAGLRTGMIGTVSVRIGDEVVDHDTRQTTPESLEIIRLLSEMRAARVDWAVVEATSHGLALHRLDTCPFDIGVVTNITHEHLDFHGSIDAYRLAKAKLLDFVDASNDRSYPRGVVINRDDEGAKSIASHARLQQVVWYGINDPNTHVRAENITVSIDGTSFDLVVNGTSRPVNLKLIGTYNVYNALGAAGAALLIGMEEDEIVAGLESLESVPGRLARVDAGQPFEVFVDYAHTPDSIEKTLRLLRSLKAGRIIIVFGSAGERDRAKRVVQGAVAARHADFAVFTSEDPRFEDPDAIIADIATGASAAGAREGRDFVRREDRQAAIETAFHAARPGDVVLLAGKGHEKCIIYGAERRPWDEATAAHAALSSLGFSGDDRMGHR